MKNKLKKRSGILFYLIGAGFIAASLRLVIDNEIKQHEAVEASEAVMLEMTSFMPPKEEHVDALPSPALNILIEDEEEDYLRVLPDYVLNPDMPMPEVEIRGESYVSSISFPDWELVLPVASEFSYDNLRISPCRFSGSLYKDDMVICAHNYGRHFAVLKEMKQGDRVAVTDLDGNVFHFKVDYKEVLQPHEIDQLMSGDWDLTLFTCTPGGENRVTVRCKRAAPEVVAESSAVTDDFIKKVW